MKFFNYMILKAIDSLLVTNPTNIRYLTGFVGAAPEEREAYVLLTKKQTYLFTNALYLETAKKTHTAVVEISREEPFAKKLAELLKRSLPARQGETLKGIRLGFEETDLTVAEYHKIMHMHKNVTFVPTQGRIEKLRMMKREDEIENIRAAAKITDECFDFIINKITPGISESDISWEIETFIRTRGAQLAFSPIVAFGKNTSQPHYSLARTLLAKLQGESLRKNEVVLLDFGARVDGYCSDMTRTVFIGKPDAKWVTAYETVLAAQQKALEYLTGPGPVTRSGRAADRLARGIIQKAGFPPYPHSLGHGVGLDIHEAPRLTIKKDQELKANMVVTVEPGIYIEGQYGVRLEDLVLLKEDGIEVLSTSKKEIIIL